LFETIISRRNISFSKKQTKGLKDKLFDAGAAEVVVVQWDTSYGSDVNEVLKNGKIENYDVITPTVWNLGPQNKKQKGIAQNAMIGVPSIEIAKVVLRSFDVCSVCTTH